MSADPASDLAVIRIKQKVEGLRRCRSAIVTSFVWARLLLAIGNPFGLSHTVTWDRLGEGAQ